MVDGGRLLVFNMDDKTFFVHVVAKSVEMLPSLGIKKYGAGLYYKSDTKYVYYFGGRETLTGQVSSCAARFDLVNRKWQKFPDMTCARYGAGVFPMENETVIYAFGWQN